MRLTSRVFKILRKDSYQPSTAEQIYKILKEPTLEFSQFKKALDILEAEGKVELAAGKYIAVAKGPDILRGRFEANTKGFGFVINPQGDIFIRSDKVNDALNGDLVEARIIPTRRRKNLEGVIVKILERSLTEIIGRIEVKGSQKWLIPADRRLHNMFLIEEAAEAKEGQMAVGSITKYPPKGTVKLTEILGDENSISVEIEIIIRQHNLRINFPDEAVAQAAELPAEVQKEDLNGRKDYRDGYVVTIDGLDAKDFDDAVSVEKRGDKYHLAVHIADVGAYVPEGSPLDIEALARGNSTYLSNRVLPMFPYELSNGVASLNPDVDRLTLSVESVINSAGAVESFEIHRGVIRSKARLTYEQVDASLKSKKFSDKAQEELLLTLLELKKILEKNRMARGSLIFETIEPKVLLDEELNPVKIMVRERSDATAIIEEMMILTNEVIARYLTKRRYPLIYRSHEEPADDALTEVEGLLRSLQYPVKQLSSVSAETYQKAIAYAHNRPDKLLVNSVLIRSMQKARYSATQSSHFGLGSSHYCHFTSPIRRYADLVVHRQVKRMLDNRFDFDKDVLTGELAEIAENISLTETESASAERESTNLMIARYMEDKVGEVFEAVIVGIVQFGFFVQIPNSAEGLVHITSLKDDYYSFEPENFLIRGRRTGKVYRLGQKIQVELTRVVVGERQLDFEVV